MKRNLPTQPRRPRGRLLRTAISLAPVAWLTLAGAVAYAAGPVSASDRSQLAPRTLPSKSFASSLSHGRDPHTLVVKLTDDGGAIARANRLLPRKGLSGPDLHQQEVAHILSGVPDVRIEPVFDFPAELLHELRREGEANTGEALADLTQFFLVRLPAGSQPRRVLQDLLLLDGVENAYAYGEFREPVDIAPPTPDFETLPPGQGYRNPAPEGVNIDAAWSRGVFGAGVTIVDVETNWNLDHEDLCHLNGQVPPVPIIPEADWRDPALPATLNISHGTATLGVINGGDNGYGVTGLARDSAIRVVPALRISDPLWLPPRSVVLATLAMQAGDVMVIELEDFAGFPYESFDAEFASVRQATALGIHVIEPAGNTPGGIDLDDLMINGILPFDLTVRDSGAVMVGAGESALQPGGFRLPYPNSNFGGRIDSHSWGQNITTLGYGPNSGTLAFCNSPANPFPAAPNMDQWYTNCYNGTSGAGAIVTGVAAILEEAHQRIFGQPFGSREMRNMLRMGVRAFGDIGHQPDLAYYLSFMQRGGVITHRFKADPRRDPFASTQELGRAVAGAGDVDGDGTPDLVVGVPGHTLAPGGAINRDGGRVRVYSGDTGRILYSFDGDSPADQLGAAVAGGGDVDGDGVPDFAAAAPGDDNTGTDAGSVRVYSGATGNVLYTLDGQAGEFFGFSIDLTGDIDGDGAADLLVGAPGDVDLLNSVGRARLFSGATGTLLRTVSVPQLGSLFGFSVAGLDDANGDGVPDFVVGSPNQDNPSGQFPGAAIVYSGAGGALSGLRGEVPFGIFGFSGFGSAVGDAGDVNGDGLADVVVGAPGWTETPGAFGFGKAYLYTGSGLLIDSFEGDQSGDQFGASVAGVGDFDGDGADDVAIGSPSSLGSPGFSFRPGRVFVYQAPFPQAQRARRVFRTLDGSTRLGISVAATGDVNGDGNGDVIAGEPFGDAEGRAYVFSNGPGPDRQSDVRLLADAGAIECRDTDGDGFGGGGLSPSASGLIIDAGPQWAGADYIVVGIPNPPWDLNPTAVSLVQPGSSALFNFTGTLDAQGQTMAPTFGPILSSLLGPGLIGANWTFFAVVRLDTDGDGIPDIGTRSTPAQITIIAEFGTC